MQEKYPNTLKLSVGLWPFHLDFKSRYPLHRLISRMVHVAGEHSTANGFGIREMMDHQRTWVLNKLSLEFDAEVSVSVPLDITTGVTTWRGLSTERALLLSQMDHLLVRGNSRWVALNTETRKPIPLAEIFPLDLPTADFPDITLPEIPRQMASKEVMAELRPVFEHTIRYSDLDINEHMNTASWIRVAQDALPLERWAAGNLSRAHMTFNREGMAGEVVMAELATVGMTDYCRLSVDGADAFWMILEWRDFSFRG